MSGAKGSRRLRKGVSLNEPAVSSRIRAMVLEGLNHAAIGRAVGASRQAIDKWCNRHAGDLEQDRAIVKVQTTGVAITERVERLRAMDERHQRLWAVVEERAADPAWAHIPGWKTGLLVRQVKAIKREMGEDKNGNMKTETVYVDEFAVDTGLLKALLELEQEATKQLGEYPSDNDKGKGGQVAASVLIIRGGGELNLMAASVVAPTTTLARQSLGLMSQVAGLADPEEEDEE